MLRKITKICWLLSFLATIAFLLFVYASLPEMVNIDAFQSFQITKNSLFYFFTFVLTMVNVLAITVDKFFKNKYLFNAWFFILICIINGFFVVTLKLVNLINSFENNDYQSIGLLVYLSIGLIFLWTSIFPLLLLSKIFIKETVSN